MSPALDAPASKPRPRNRLRKLTKLRRGPAACANNDNISPRASSDSGRTPALSLSPLSPRRGSVPPSPDLSSQKWLEYIRKSGYLCPMEESPHLQHTRSRSLTHHPNSNLVPELAHLAIDIPDKSPRRSLETQRATASPKSASSSLRRYAKTPVTRVGQLEANQATTPRAEPIAEQYRSLLRSRSHDDLRRGGVGDGSDGNTADTRQASIEAIRGAIRRRSPLLPARSPPSTPGPEPEPQPELDPGPEPRGSPTSDGTLVAFEEDTIFFKPVSFWPEPLSPIREGGGGGGEDDNYDNLASGNDGLGRSERPLPRPGVLSLQIATNLLFRELSCAVSNEAMRAPTDVRQLQTWVMIEAYETLRDQVLQMGLPADEAEALRGAFDMWLRALYRVHDGFARETSGPSDGDIEAIQAEDLD
ncbi:putative mating-type switching protein swi10 [Diaporthe ampelina]|uniref:Putative mating-type switching protein swi10 n=1 Tax=Diaporthe ampelina TaxID=1214573 RepID=A0A0G2HVJ0_9PEZI|nr:putative mating-type switching protein swi10 [Diaporthe ampelina]